MSKTKTKALRLGSGILAFLALATVGYFVVTHEPGAGTGRDLVLAAKANNVAGIKSALDSGADPNSKLGQSMWESWTSPPEPNLGYTALHYAAEWINVPAEQLLLDHKANPNAMSTEGRTPIMIATGHLGVDFIKRLLAAGADPLIKDHWSHNALDHLPRMASAERMAPVRQLLGGMPSKTRSRGAIGGPARGNRPRKA